MTDLAAALTTALLAGLLGSAHCLGMCGGISGLFALHSGVRGLRRQLPMALTYNAGRLVSYMILGSAVAALGSRIADLTPTAAGPVRLVAGAVIILIGLQIAFDIRALGILERMGGVAWSRISPLASRLLPVNSLPRALGLGLLWGLLPCGLVYSVLLVAATSSRAVDGAFVMLAFGIGTTPAMLLTGLGAARLAQLMQDRAARRWSTDRHARYTDALHADYSTDVARSAFAPLI
jgi:sulfite exporter TauE/SafE